MDELKRTDIPPQLGILSKKESIINLRGAFECKARITDMKLLLIYDVMTTRATARECSKELT